MPRHYSVVRASQTIVTVLPSTPQVDQVYTKQGGVLEALREFRASDAERTLCIDSTTLDVEFARQVAGQVTEAGAFMLDAPVSGGQPLHSTAYGLKTNMNMASSQV